MGKIINCLSAAVLAASLSLPAISKEKPQQPKQDKPQVQALDGKVNTADVTTAQITSELNKHGEWLLDVLEQDYTNDVREKPVRFVRESCEARQDKESLGLIGFAAAYLFEERKVLIPRPLNEEEADRILDAIDHEVGGHVWWHNVPDSEGYEGPSVAEIASYCEERVQREDLTFVRKKLILDEEINTSKIAMAKIKSGMNALTKGIMRCHSRYNSALEEANGLKENIDLEEFEEIRDRYVVYAKDATSWYQGCKQLANGNLTERVHESLKGVSDNVTRENIAQYQEATELCKEACRAYLVKLNAGEAIYKRSEDILKDLENVVCEAKIAKIDASIRELRELMQLDPSSKKEYMKQIKCKEVQKIFLKENRGLVGFLDMFEGFNESFYSSIQDFAGARNSYMLDQVLSNPEEVYARIADATASLHYGEPTVQYFTPNDEDLDLLERCGHGKIVSKYRLGKRMIEDGWNPKDVKETLEYAESFVYKGVRYNWEGLGICFVGEFPERAPFGEGGK